jgi:serine/threonine-protein kinase
LHRDFKPDNVLVGGDGRVRVTDFGLAAAKPGESGKLAQQAVSDVNLTTSGSVLGTPAYMAPEQCRGGLEVDARADLYSVGCILFELLTGRPPFLGSGDGEVMAMHIYEPPPRLTNLVPDMPVELDALLARLLTKSPEDRIPSAAYALASLERAPLGMLAGEVPLSGAHGLPAAASVVHLEAPPPPEPMPRWIPVVVISTALIIAVAVAYVIGVT